MLLAVLAGPYVRLSATNILNVTAASYSPSSRCSAWEYTELLARAETGGGPSYAVISHPSALGRMPTSPVFFFLVIRWAEVLQKPFNGHH